MERKYTQKRALFILASIKIVNKTYALELCIMFVIFILLPKAYGKISPFVTVYSTHKKSLPYHFFLPLFFFSDRVVLFYVYILCSHALSFWKRHCLLDKCEWTKSFPTNHTTEKHYSCLLWATYIPYNMLKPWILVNMLTLALLEIYSQSCLLSMQSITWKSLHVPPHKRCYFIIRLYFRDAIANKNKNYANHKHCAMFYRNSPFTRIQILSCSVLDLVLSGFSFSSALNIDSDSFFFYFVSRTYTKLTLRSTY